MHSCWVNKIKTKEVNPTGEAWVMMTPRIPIILPEENISQETLKDQKEQHPIKGS